MEAFALAIRLGANGVETDAWVTLDGVAVLDHDGVVRRMGRKIPISRVGSRHLPDHIPTVDDLFRSLPDGHHVSIDVKDADATRLIAESALRNGIRPDRVWLCFHRIGDAIAARPRHPDFRIVDSSRLKRINEGLERRAALLAENSIDVLNMHISDWTGGSVALVHRFGIFAFGWDLQQDHALSTGIRMGLDAVYSDDVALMVDVYSREVGHPPRPGESE